MTSKDFNLKCLHLKVIQSFIQIQNNAQSLLSVEHRKIKKDKRNKQISLKNKT